VPLFRAADGKRKQFTRKDYKAHSIRQMMKRRLEDAGLPELFSPHSFRVTAVTDLLNQNVCLIRMCRSKMCSISPGMQARRQRAFMIGGGGASHANCLEMALSGMPKFTVDQFMAQFDSDYKIASLTMGISTGPNVRPSAVSISAVRRRLLAAGGVQNWLVSLNQKVACEGDRLSASLVTR